MTSNQNISPDNDSLLSGALGQLGQQEIVSPDQLTRQRHLKAMRAARRSYGISRLVGAAAAVVLIAGAFVTTKSSTHSSSLNNNAADAPAELAPLKKVTNLTAVPFNRTEQYLMLDVKAANASAVKKELTSLMGTEPSVVQNNNSSTTFVVPDSVAKKLSNTQGVTATIDTPVKATVDQTPTPSWGLDRIDATSVALDNKYTYFSTGASSYVYVIDTGVYSGSADLAGRVTSGYTAVADGNGTEDCNGHGTHVAGTIAGTNYGVAKSTRIVAVRVLDCAGSGFTSSVIAGINWVIQSHPGGAGVINLSLGGAANSQLDTAVANATAAGLTVVVAAGNNAADACNYSPARAPSAITVGAITSSDAVASYSNTGSCVDLYAPGSNITSDWIGGATATNTISGTSMATPHVVGLAARLAQAYPGISNADIVSKLTAGTIAAPVAISTFAEPDPVTTTTTVATTVPAPTTTTVDPGVTTTTIVAPTTTVAAPTTTTTTAPKKVRKVITPRSFNLDYKIVNGSTALVASWIDDQSPETYRVECARNRGMWGEEDEDQTDDSSSAESAIIIERVNVRPGLGGRSEATVVLPPANDSHCWMVAMVGNVSSKRSNVAIVPRAPRVPVTTTTTIPRTTTTTIPRPTTTTVPRATTTTVTPTTVPATTTTVAAAKATPGVIATVPKAPVTTQPRIPTTTVRTTVNTKAPKED